MFRSLNNKNFARFFAGGLCSDIGNMMQMVAAAWLVYRLTESTYYVGVFHFIKQLMSFLVSPIAGVLADNFDRKTLFLFSNAVLGIIALIIGLLIINEWMSIGGFLTIYVVIGAALGMNLTIRMPFVRELIGPEGPLVNAVALSSMLLNIARVVGPVIAGLLIPLYGEGSCFLVLAAGQFANILLLLSIEHNFESKRQKQLNYGQSLKSGIQYLRKAPYMSTLVLYTTLLGLIAMPFNVVLPSYASQVLGGNSDYLGFLTASMGTGALFSALILSNLKNAIGFERLMFFAGMSYGAAILTLSFTNQFWPSIMCMGWIGMSQIAIFASGNLVLQTLSHNDVLGRVLSLYITTFMGATMIGCYFIGFIAEHMGIMSALLLCGSGTLLVTVCYGLLLNTVTAGMQRRLKRLGMIG